MSKKSPLTVEDVMAGRRRCISTGEAPKSTEQHKTPCGDCPFTKAALNGWLGGTSIEEWIEILRSDRKIPCHAIRGPQCAGAAILRANICKSPRDKTVLALPADRETVFGSLQEFEKHHTSRLTK
jgi:hypothetical protein